MEVPQEVLEGSPDEAFFQVTVLEEQLRGMSPDLGAIEAYAAKEAELESKQGELASFTAERDVVGPGGKQGVLGAWIGPIWACSHVCGHLDVSGG